MTAKLADFDYHLPPELIAQEPPEQRDSSRLMTFERSTGRIGESNFSEIGGLFRRGDLLVVNDTRVIPARLHGVKATGGKIEVFLVSRLDPAVEGWRCLLRSSKPCRPGTFIHLAEGMTALVEENLGDGVWRLSFTPVKGFSEWLERVGSMPLPPYIRREASDRDRERYQTVFAHSSGAVAAPTAGLHFTEELLDGLRKLGVEIATLTLHVGLGTFMPLRVDDLSHHRMHREWFHIPDATAAAIAARKDGGGRVIALGTTTTRALEQAARGDGSVESGEGEADLFITPGYCFKVIDALITNFHLPKSTLLMLVSAFAGRELLLKAYSEAVARRFRFYSYGDAMIIL
jgi:S-adenosylmethionine:tRNA ribosyltransferase-isomerase